MTAPPVIVVGAGVLGLTCAAALRQAGHRVRVVARDEPTVSEVAGGLWLPYATARDERVLGWALATLERLVADGHRVVDYLHLEREEPWWLDALPSGQAREARADELPAGHERGWVARVPLVRMPAHLEALAAVVGSPVERVDVRSLDELGPGVVVHCSGLAARTLACDATVRPVRGQVVLVDAPVGTPCVRDEDSLTYVLPREDVCVVGGTHEPDVYDTTVRPEQTAAILARAVALVPGLAGAEVLGARVGLRPVRDGGPRVEREGRVVHCYGHGGSGLTLSWGCAAEVVRLVGAAG